MNISNYLYTVFYQEHKISRYNVADSLHTRAWFGNVHVNHYGDVSIFYRLRPLNMLKMTESDFDNYSDAIHGFIKKLPENSHLQFLYQKNKLKYLENESDENGSSELNYIKKQRGGNENFYEIDNYLVLTFGREAKRTSKYSTFLLNQGRRAKVSRNAIKSGVESIKAFEPILFTELEFLDPAPLDLIESTKLLYRFYNITSEIPKDIKVRPDFYNYDLIDKNYAANRRGVSVGSDDVAAITMYELPAKMSAHTIDEWGFKKSTLSLILRQKFPLFLSVGFSKLEKSAATSLLERKANQAKFFTMFNKEISKEALREIYGDEMEPEDYPGIKKIIEREEQSLLEMSVTAIAWDNDPEQLKKKERDLVYAFNRLDGAKAVVENEDALNVILACAPGNVSEHSRKIPILSVHAANFVNLCAHYKGEGEGITFLNKDDRIINYDLFDADNENYNGIVIGPSGSGKSFTTNNIIHKYIEKGARILILDDGGSYRPLVNLLHGDYVEISAENAQNIDPFVYYNPNEKTEGVERAAAFAFVSDFIEVMLLKEGQSVIEKNLKHELDKSIKGYVSVLKENEKPSLIKFLIFLTPGEIYFKNDTVFRKYALDTIEFYVVGRYAEYFAENNENIMNISGEQAVTAFDTAGVSGQKELFPLFAFMISKMAFDAMKETENRFIFIMDEAWKALAESEAIKRFTITMFRTARKYGSSIITISQNISDFGGELAKSIITNCQNKFFLRHKPEDIAVVSELFNFGQAQEESFRLLKKFEIFLLRGEEPIIIKSYFSDVDYWLYTTNSIEKEKRDRLLKQNSNNLIRTLKQLTETSSP